MGTGQTADRDPKAEINILNLQFVHFERSAFAVKTLIENEVLDEAVKHLHKRGCDQLAISVEPLAEIQHWLRERQAAQGDDEHGAYKDEAADQRLEEFERSRCGPGPVYPPRPPDDWPEGPWDPPRPR